MKKVIFKSSALIALFTPALAFAQISLNLNGSGQQGPDFTYVDSWVGHALYYLQLSITVITVLLTVFFLASVLRYVMNRDPNKAKDLQRLMLNGLIGLFISVAVWGIIRLAGNITGVGSGTQLQTITCPPGQNYYAGTASTPGTCR